MDLNELWVFAKVVRAGSFTAAARALDMPKSTVSRKVSELEERLGARLLQRTTRSLHLTDVGRAYYEHCERIVAELAEAENAVTRMQQSPRGLLKVTAPLNFGFLGSVVSDFLKTYPETSIELICTDRVVNIVEEGFDVAVRAGPLSDSALIARLLGTWRRVMVASPAYLKKNGTLRAPEDLLRHHCIVFGAGEERHGWKVSRAGKHVELTVPARLVVNDVDIVLKAALSGLGIALIPADRCAEDLRLGRLRPVLEDWCSQETAIHAVYASGRQLSAKVKAFIDFLKDHMTPPPWE